MERSNWMHICYLCKTMLYEQLDIVAVLMTQLLVKAVFKEWGTEVHKDLHF